jgi:hypothetical protein
MIILLHNYSAYVIIIRLDVKNYRPLGIIMIESWITRHRTAAKFVAALLVLIGISSWPAIGYIYLRTEPSMNKFDDVGIIHGADPNVHQDQCG